MPSVPSLLLDLLVGNGGQLSAQRLKRAGALFGVGDVAIRVGLSRLVEQGKLVRDRRGVYHVRADAAPLLTFVSDWRDKPSLRRPWCGGWLAVHESPALRQEKTAWRRHRLALSLWGFLPLGDGLSLRPDNLHGPLDDFRTRLSGTGLASSAMLFRLSALDQTREAQARELWDVDALNRESAALLERIVRSHARLAHLALDEAARESLLLGREAIAHLVRDPLLPQELTPSTRQDALREAVDAYQRLARQRWLHWLARTDDGDATSPEQISAR